MNERKYSKSFVHTQARNIRYLFIVDSKIHTDELLSLFRKNQQFWGGRFNPIIPSYDGKIPTEYIELAKLFDPDYVVYSTQVDIDSLKHDFNPLDYIEISNFKYFQQKGLSANYLLSREPEYMTVLSETSLHRSMPELSKFYKLNFGFIDSHVEENTKFKHILINKTNQDELKELLAFNSVIYSSTLSCVNVKRPVLDINFSIESQFEIIISDDENQFKDLLYFWNRILYSQYEPKDLCHLYFTKKQLVEFLKNPTESFFEAVGGTSDIKLLSFSISNQELQKFGDDLDKIEGIKMFEVIKAPVFPFPFNGLVDDNSSYEEPIIKQSLHGNEDLVHLPILSFYNSNKNYGNWAVDILLERTEDIQQNKVLLPCKPDLTMLFCNDTNGRINGKHQITQFVNYNIRSLDFTIPTDEEIFKELLIKAYNDTDGDNAIERIEVSDAGIRLSALLNLFNYSFPELEYFFQHEMWINIFSGISIKKDEDRMKLCKGVVSFKDLIAEYRDTNEVKKRKVDEEAINEDLKFCLNKLVKFGAYFIGNKVKCDNCGSSLWYGLPEIGNSFSCKGCMQNINVPIESLVYYKLNDVIKNNLISNSGTKKNTHGNYTVLAALFSLKRNSEKSFYLLPSQNYYKPNSKTPFSDIDIICMSDGKFIIGEAKNSYSDFNTREIDNLIFLGDYLDPDKIILAYNEGEQGKLDSKIKKIKERLKNKSIEVKAIKVADPFFI